MVRNMKPFGLKKNFKMDDTIEVGKATIKSIGKLKEMDNAVKSKFTEIYIEDERGLSKRFIIFQKHTEAGNLVTLLERGFFKENDAIRFKYRMSSKGKGFNYIVDMKHLR